MLTQIETKNIEVFQATDWEFELVVVDQNGNPFLNFFPALLAAKMQVRTEKNTVSTLIASFSDTGDGDSIQDGLLFFPSTYECRGFMRVSVTAFVPAGNYYYDLRIQYSRDNVPNDYITEFETIYLRGTFTVLPVMTEPIS